MIFLPKCRPFYVILEKGHGTGKGHGAREKGHGTVPCQNWLGEHYIKTVLLSTHTICFC